MQRVHVRVHASYKQHNTQLNYLYRKRVGDRCPGLLMLVLPAQGQRVSRLFNHRYGAAAIAAALAPVAVALESVAASIARRLLGRTSHDLRPRGAGEGPQISLAHAPG